MAELTQEQKRALAIASARLRLNKQQEPSADFSGAVGGSSTTAGDTGVMAALRRSASTLNPLNWIAPNAGPLPGMSSGQAQELAARAMAGDAAAKAELEKGFNQQQAAVQNTSNKDLLRGSMQTLAPSTGGLFSMADRATYDPFGALTEGAVTVGVPLAIANAPSIAKAGVRRTVDPAYPAELYQRALKPSTTLSQADRARIIGTALKEGIPVSPAGASKLTSLVNAINEDIKGKIAASTETISPISAASRVNQVVPRFRDTVNPKADLQTLGKVKKEFLGQHMTKATPAVPGKPSTILNEAGEPAYVTPGTPSIPAKEIPISVQKAQQIKINTYRQLKDKAFGELKGADIEGQKAVVRGIKEEIAGKTPAISGLNLRESRLLELESPLERALGREGNKDVVGIGTPIAGGAVATMTGNAPVGILAGLLKSLGDRPDVKSRVAIALAKALREQPQAANLPPSMPLPLPQDDFWRQMIRGTQPLR